MSRFEYLNDKQRLSKRVKFDLKLIENLNYELPSFLAVQMAF